MPTGTKDTMISQMATKAVHPLSIPWPSQEDIDTAKASLACLLSAIDEAKRKGHDSLVIHLDDLAIILAAITHIGIDLGRQKRCLEELLGVNGKIFTA